MSSQGNSSAFCALTSDTQPESDAPDDAGKAHFWREQVAAFARANPLLKLEGGKTLDELAHAHVKTDIITWAADFEEDRTMSDALVLIIWPLLMNESVCVWYPQGEGYKHSSMMRFTPSGGAGGVVVRHLLYDSLHYDALVIEPSVIWKAESAKEAAEAAQVQVAKEKAAKAEANKSEAVKTKAAKAEATKAKATKAKAAKAAAAETVATMAKAAKAAAAETEAAKTEGTKNDKVEAGTANANIPAGGGVNLSPHGQAAVVSKILAKEPTEVRTAKHESA